MVPVTDLSFRFTSTTTTGKDNCIQLYNDLIKTAKYNKPSHFLEVLSMPQPTMGIETIT